jgi:hypothetical protein
MRNLCLRTVLSTLLLYALSGTHVLWAHGSVVDSGEGCVIQFDFYSAHFSIFQPQTRQHEEFCEDLPDVTESVFVLEYRHDSLREVPVDFRIMRNTSDLGRFVRWQDIEAMGDLTAHTVFYQRSSPRADGVLSMLFNFTEPGDYVGIVSAPHPTLDLQYHAVFPFRVGQAFWQQSWFLIALIVVLVQSARVWRRRQLPTQQSLA